MCVYIYIYIYTYTHIHVCNVYIYIYIHIKLGATSGREVPESVAVGVAGRGPHRCSPVTLSRALTGFHGFSPFVRRRLSLFRSHHRGGLVKGGIRILFANSPHVWHHQRTCLSFAFHSRDYLRSCASVRKFIPSPPFNKPPFAYLPCVPGFHIHKRSQYILIITITTIMMMIIPVVAAMITTTLITTYIIYC